MAKIAFISKKSFDSLAIDSPIMEGLKGYIVVLFGASPEEIVDRNMIHKKLVEEGKSNLAGFAFIPYADPKNSFERQILFGLRESHKHKDPDWVWIRDENDVVTEKVVKYHSILISNIKYPYIIDEIAKTRVIYISLPMTGQEDTIIERYDKAVQEVKERYPNAFIMGPWNIDEFRKDSNHERPYTWSFYMGKDLQIVLESEMIYMCYGWEESRGCRTELAVARENQIPAIYQIQ